MRQPAVGAADQPAARDHDRHPVGLRGGGRQRDRRDRHPERRKPRARPSQPQGECGRGDRPGRSAEDIGQAAGQHCLPMRWQRVTRRSGRLRRRQCRAATVLIRRSLPNVTPYLDGRCEALHLVTGRKRRRACRTFRPELVAGRRRHTSDEPRPRPDRRRRRRPDRHPAAPAVRLPDRAGPSPAARAALYSDKARTAWSLDRHSGRGQPAAGRSCERPGNGACMDLAGSLNDRRLPRPDRVQLRLQSVQQRRDRRPDRADPGHGRRPHLVTDGDRTRPALNAPLQWRPTPDLEFYVDGILHRLSPGFRRQLLRRPAQGRRCHGCTDTRARQRDPQLRG